MRGLSFLPALSFPVPLSLPFRITPAGLPFSIPLPFTLTVPIVVVPENNIQITTKIQEALKVKMYTTKESKTSPGLEMSGRSPESVSGWGGGQFQVTCNKHETNPKTGATANQKYSILKLLLNKQRVLQISIFYQLKKSVGEVWKSGWSVSYNTHAETETIPCRQTSYTSLTHDPQCPLASMYRSVHTEGIQQKT
jgi:hypothetical protein